MVGQLKLMVPRVVNMLNDSDIGTCTSFLDTIVEHYNESPHSGLGRGRTPIDVCQKHFCTKGFLIFVFKLERFCDADNAFKSVSRKVCSKREALASG